MSSKQATRNSQKRAAKKEVVQEPASEESSTVSPGKLLETCKMMIMGSCIVKFAPKMKHIMQVEGPLSGDVKKADPAPAPPAQETENEASETKTTEGTNSATCGDETVEVFDGLASRIVWHNPLGLAKPATAADSATLWYSFKSQELDWGPAKRKKDTASVNLNRIMGNLCNNFTQYVHIFLALLTLQAFLFRSFFACLPWLVFYQTASLLIPLKTLEVVPQVPLSKCPMKFRVAATMGIHTLVWLFFLYEALWKCNFFVEGLILGLICVHAHSVKPGALSN